MKVICPKCHFEIADGLLRGTAAHPRGEVICQNCAAASALSNAKSWPAYVGSCVVFAMFFLGNLPGNTHLGRVAFHLAALAALVATIFWIYKLRKLTLCASTA
jgi:hypothetical protein